MVLLTWLAIYPQVLLLSWLLRQLPLNLPPPVFILITTGIAVPMLGYVLMPRLTRLLEPWLSAPSDRVPQSSTTRADESPRTQELS